MIRILFALFLCLCAEAVCAQTESDSSAAIARRILDEPGATEFDPTDVFNYLDLLHLISGHSIDSRHASPERSWLTARSMSQSSNSNEESISGSVRSRAGESLSAKEQQGYLNSQYLGSAGSLSNRVLLSVPGLAIGALGQKQAWEPNYADKLSAFLTTTSPIDVGPVSINQLVIGDFAVSIGQGLLFRNGPSLAHSTAAALSIEDRSFGIRPAFESSAATSLRGLASEFAAGPLSLSVFGSRNYFDARVNGDTIVTIEGSSYHRTASELAVKNTASSSLIGACLTIATPDTSGFYLSGGLTAYSLEYSGSYSGTTSNPFVGNILHAASASLLAVGNRVSSSTEAAFIQTDSSSALAFSSSCMFQVNAHTSLSLRYQHVPYGFYSPMSSVSSSTNGDGFYAGFQTTAINDALTLNAYTDLIEGLLPINSVLPKRNREYVLSLAGAPLPNVLKLTATVRSQIADEPTTSTRTSYRLDAEYRLASWISGRSRYEFLAVPTLSQTGWLVSQELTGRLRNTTLTLRAAHFISASYSSGIYLYEPSVLADAASILTDGRGMRLSGSLAFRAAKHLTFSIALAGTLYNQPRLLGSGLTQHYGSSDMDATCQLDLRF